MSVAVLGAGAFGTALAVVLTSAKRPGEVTLWARDPGHADQMTATRQNARRLPGVTLPDGLQITSDLNAVSQAATVLLAVPTQQLAGLLASWPDRPDQALVACCKGVDMASGLGPSGVIQTAAPSAKAAVLTGPSFAQDIATGLPTALTLACADENTQKALQQSLSAPTLRLYRTGDIRGAELGGALKNVIAIAAGVSLGAGLGESARAAVVTRGFAEIVQFATARGARPETLHGLSGFGDLILTCTSTQSRNFRFGQALGADESFDAGVTVEGAATARAVAALAAKAGMDLPVIQTVAKMLDDDLSAAEAARSLLSRPLRAE